MGLTETILFYLLFGGGVAAAVALAQDKGGRGERLFRTTTALVFWPLYVPMLLDRPARPAAPLIAPPSSSSTQQDSFAQAIAQVEAELETALDSLDGWAENVLAGEQDRFAELRAAWRLQADRIRQLDRLLSTSAKEGEEAQEGPVSAMTLGGSGRFQHSEEARRDNLKRLHAVRTRLHDDLTGTLAWV